MSLLRQLAFHEAAHAIVARHHGLTVHEIRIGEHSGVTTHAGSATPRQFAAVTAAGGVGQEFCAGQVLDLACDDLRRFEAEHGLGALWQAQRDARAILTTHRAALVALAGRAERERVLVFGGRAA